MLDRDTKELLIGFGAALIFAIALIYNARFAELGGKFAALGCILCERCRAEIQPPKAIVAAMM
jgi:hypothetical protein